MTGLTNGTEYTFAVRAVNDIDAGAASDDANPVTPAGVPDKPTNLVATRGDTEVGLTWTASGNNGESIDEHQYTYDSGATWTTIDYSAPGGANATSYTVTGLTNGTEYTFAVRAVNDIDAGAASDDANPVTPAGVPDKPTNLVATRGDTEVGLTWTASGNNGESIDEHQYTFDSGATWTTIDYSAPGGANATSYTVTGLTNGTEYTFAVRAVNDIDAGAASDDANPVTPAGVPDKPTNLVATRGDTEVGLTWSASGNNGESIDEHQYTYDSGATWTTIDYSAPGGANATSYTVTGLTNGTEYTFAVRAVNDIDAGAASDDANPVTPAGVPDKPTNLVATRGDTEVGLTWTASGNNGESIDEHQYTFDSGATWTTILNSAPPSGANATSYTVTGLTNGTEYTFAVRAVNDIDAGAASDDANPVTPAGVPDKPTNLVATRGDTEVGLTWSASGNNGERRATIIGVLVLVDRFPVIAASSPSQPNLGVTPGSYQIGRLIRHSRRSNRICVV